jgi:hypothetical protein
MTTRASDGGVRLFAFEDVTPASTYHDQLVDQASDEVGMVIDRVRGYSEEGPPDFMIGGPDWTLYPACQALARYFGLLTDQSAVHIRLYNPEQQEVYPWEPVGEGRQTWACLGPPGKIRLRHTSSTEEVELLTEHKRVYCLVPGPNREFHYEMGHVEVPGLRLLMVFTV